MHIKALVLSLVLATTVAALPLGREGSEWPSLKDSLNDIGNNNENNPEVGSDNGNNNGNNNGSGNTIGQNKFEFSGDNNFLTDLVNINYGAMSKQISEDVVAALKSLTSGCSSDEKGAMSCKWQD
ncbi:hypothetical protein F5Y08DRAFT_296505 [Xylaria arbuscula]|nr:hypothetical protein F5Y08DRAFT_296505 [Xylaria arbuscula]